MKINLSCVGVVAALLIASSSAQANFTINPETYNPGDASKGVIWFDTVGTMNYDGIGNPQNVVGSLGNDTVKVDFLFTFGSFTAVSQVYSLDHASGSILAFGTISGRSVETINSVEITPGLTGTYQVRAWVGGSSFNDPSNTKTGSSTANNPLTFGGTPAAGPPATPSDLTGFSSFAVVSVPEPATIFLGIFGAAGLLVRRRK